MNDFYSPSPAAIPPPPPPPAKKKPSARVWIIVLGIFLALCCCAALLIVGYAYRSSIPGVSALFATPTFTPSPTPTSTPTPLPTPTPSDVSYRSSSMNFSLLYPEGWTYQEEYPLVAFTPDEYILTSDAPMQTATILMIFRQTAAAWEFPAAVDTTSPVAIVDYFITSIPCSQTLWNTRAFQVDSEPAASFACLVTQGDPDYVTYLAAITPGDSILIIIGFSPQDVWSQNQPLFDGILGSMRIDPF